MSVSPPQVVLFPDLIIHALCNHEPSRAILERWRDGKIRPVSTRGLLERYLRTLAGLGLKDVALRRWIWWFTSPRCSVYLRRSVAADSSTEGVCLCSVLAEETQSEVIYAKPRPGDWPPPTATTIAPWTAAEDFLKR